MIAVTQTLGTEGLDVVAMLTGYVLTVATAFLFMRATYTSVRKDHRIRGLEARLKRRDERIGFLTRQNRALFERTSHARTHRRRRDCRTHARSDR
jgi:hypothetical protein